MKSPLLFATIWLSTAGALAQPVPSVGPGNELREAAREQRRADLRTALQSHRQADPRTAKSSDAPSAGRHLSARELAEMRQQLRQQQAEGQHYRH